MEEQKVECFLPNQETPSEFICTSIQSVDQLKRKILRESGLTGGPSEYLLGIRNTKEILDVEFKKFMGLPTIQSLLSESKPIQLNLCLRSQLTEAGQSHLMRDSTPLSSITDPSERPFRKVQTDSQHKSNEPVSNIPPKLSESTNILIKSHEQDTTLKAPPKTNEILSINTSKNPVSNSPFRNTDHPHPPSKFVESQQIEHLKKSIYEEHHRCQNSEGPSLSQIPSIIVLQRIFERWESISLGKYDSKKETSLFSIDELKELSLKYPLSSNELNTSVSIPSPENSQEKQNEKELQISNKSVEIINPEVPPSPKTSSESSSSSDSSINKSQEESLSVSQTKGEKKKQIRKKRQEKKKWRLFKSPDNNTRRNYKKKKKT